jgi:hypothetical protein
MIARPLQLQPITQLNTSAAGRVFAEAGMLAENFGSDHVQLQLLRA